MKRYARTERLLGPASTRQLQPVRIALFGLGGVGGFALEALARAGIGSFHLIDADVFDESNLNRQLLARIDTLGQKKVDVARQHLAQIAPEAKVTTWPLFYLPERAECFPFDSVDFVLDCIDTVSAKISLAEECAKHRLPFLSAMGAGNKFYAERLQIADLEDTHTCPLARVLRTELRKRHLRGVRVVFSDEPAVPRHPDDVSEERAPGSMPYLPGVAGLLLAEQVLLSLTGHLPLPIPFYDQKEAPSAFNRDSALLP